MGLENNWIVLYGLAHQGVQHRPVRPFPLEDAEVALVVPHGPGDAHLLEHFVDVAPPADPVRDRGGVDAAVFAAVELQSAGFCDAERLAEVPLEGFLVIDSVQSA